jgi:type I restriction enzyme, S subunit
MEHAASKHASMTQLGNVCELVNGRAFKPSEWEKDGTPIIRIQNLNDPSKPFNYFTGVLPEKFRVRRGDVLLSWSGTPGTSFGCFLWDGPDGWLNQHIFRVVLDTAKVIPAFFVFQINALLGQIIKRAHGGVGLQHITKGELSSIKLWIPSPSTQQHVVDLLSRAAGIVLLRREAEKKAAELIPALFLDMFGDPGRNPKGWPKVLLGDLCSRITDGTHQPPAFQESGIPFIFVANIVRGELTLNASKFISEETYTELTKRCPIERDDVLYSTVGSFGVPVKVDTDERFSFQRHIAHLKPYRDRLDSDFLVGMLSTPALKGQADAAARGVAQKTINLGEIRKFQVIAPPIEEQKRFAVQVEAARSIQSQQSTATAKAKATFDALLAVAFSA